MGRESGWGALRCVDVGRGDEVGAAAPPNSGVRQCPPDREQADTGAPHVARTRRGATHVQTGSVPLDIVLATGPLLTTWQTIHNSIIPTSPLSADEVAERSTRHRLTLAYADGTWAGNATLRPPYMPDAVATVIVRILPEHRRRGYGMSYLQAELAEARRLGARRIETVVLESNTDGLAFARAHGFVEHDRYVLDGDTIAFIDLHLPQDT
jgi:GNAT superfamily N-acetyltransferase